LPRQGVRSANSTGGETAGAVGNLLVTVTGGDQRSFATLDVGSVAPPLEMALAAGQLLAYLRFHSKSLLERMRLLASVTMQPRNCRKDFAFFDVRPGQRPATSLG